MLLLRLTKKEILHNVLSLRFSVFFVLLFVLVCVSVLVMAENYKKQLKDFTMLVMAQREDLQNLASAHEMRYMGLTGYKQPNELAIFSSGLDKIISKPIQVSTYREKELLASGYSNPVFSLFSTPDVAYIVNIVMSLIALLLTFDSICGEHESETLQLLMSHSVSRDRVLIGKALGAYATIIPSFLMSLLTGIILLLAFSPVAFTVDSWLRLGSLVVLSLLYISVFITLGLFISTCTRKSSSGLMVCLFVWVFFVLAVPNVVPVISREIVGQPSSGEITGQLRSVERDEWAKYFTQSMNLSDRDRDALRDTIANRVRDAQQDIKTNFDNIIARQADLAAALSRISPSASFVYAASNITRSGVGDYKNLKKFYEKFESDFRDAVAQIERANAGTQRQNPFEANRSQQSEFVFRISDLPEFNFIGSDFKRACRESLLDILILFIFNVFFFLGSYVMFLRYKIHGEPAF